ncbi:MAG TPA: SurA N-terminal domain-containing protein [Pyrinomonadaceae bacterium]|nr:SurA N-terminal domain-containing protein [Pyrinomonadaceae bacterium]
MSNRLKSQRSRVKVRNIAKVLIVTCLFVSGLVLNGCASGGAELQNNNIAATVNGHNIMLSEVERVVSQQAGGNTSSLNQLQMAQARLQVLSNLIQREVLFQRAEREKVLPTEAQIDGAIAAQKQNSGMTSEDFDKSLKAQNMSMETLREEARKDLAISALQDKYSGKIDISDREVEEFYNNNRDRFKNERGVALAMIVVDPADNSSTGITDDAKNDADAKLKIDNIYQQLQGKADFATVARAKSEDINTLVRGGDIGFLTEPELRNNNFSQELISSFFGPMQVGDYTQPTRFNSGKWYIFKLAERRLAAENLTLESPGVRQQIAQGLTNQRKELLKAALVETALNDAKIVNNLATNMLNNPSNLGLRPAADGATSSQPTQAPTQQQPATTPATTSSPVSVKPANANANTNK